MSKTIAQIVEMAAENLGIYAEGETLASYKSDDLTKSYNEVYAELQGLRLIAWSETASIPDQYAKSIAMLVAHNRATRYQIPTDSYQRIVLEGWGGSLDGQAMKMIRKLQHRAKMGVTEIENF